VRPRSPLVGSAALASTPPALPAARFGSVDEFVRTEVESTPLRDRIDDDV